MQVVYNSVLQYLLFLIVSRTVRSLGFSGLSAEMFLRAMSLSLHAHSSPIPDADYDYSFWT
jgi:hypothetical protein